MISRCAPGRKELILYYCRCGHTQSGSSWVKVRKHARIFGKGEAGTGGDQCGSKEPLRAPDKREFGETRAGGGRGEADGFGGDDSFGVVRW